MDPNSPPLGIPPLIWVLIFLIGGPGVVGALCTSAAAKLPGMLGSLGRWWQGRRARKLDELAQPAAARIDDAEIERLSRRYEQLAADAERDRKQHRAELAEVRGQVAELKESLTLSNQRMWAAVGYIRILVDAIRQLDPLHPIPDPPDKLADII